MIPIIAASVAKNNTKKMDIYKGSNKVLDRCFMYTIIGFVCFFGMLAII